MYTVVAPIAMVLFYFKKNKKDSTLINYISSS